MTGKQLFLRSHATYGEEIVFTTGTTLLLSEPVQVNFTSNLADKNGGAIYFQGDSDFVGPGECGAEPGIR